METRPKRSRAEDTDATKLEKKLDLTFTDQNYWEKFNYQIHEWGQMASVTKSKEATGYVHRACYPSYTHAFFSECPELYNHLNPEADGIVQIGASTGKFMAELSDLNGWSTVGYDGSRAAINALIQNNITPRHVNLDEIDSTGKLAWRKTLAEDIRHHPVNILLIRILEHLSEKAATLLLFYLIKKAAKGSVIVIAGGTDDAGKIHTKRNYYASIFAARRDMEIVTHGDAFAADAYLVVRKRA